MQFARLHGKAHLSTQCSATSSSHFIPPIHSDVIFSVHCTFQLDLLPLTSWHHLAQACATLECLCILNAISQYPSWLLMRLACQQSAFAALQSGISITRMPDVAASSQCADTRISVLQRAQECQLPVDPASIASIIGCTLAAGVVV